MSALRIRRNNPLDASDVIALCIAVFAVVMLAVRGDWCALPVGMFALVAIALRFHSTTRG